MYYQSIWFSFQWCSQSYTINNEIIALCAVLLRKNDKTFGEDDAANSADGDDSNKKHKLII